MSELAPVTDIVISGDSHVAEPPDLWQQRLPAKFRDRAPTFPNVKFGTHNYYRAGGWDPVARLHDMAADGVSAEVLFPSIAGGTHAKGDVELAQACDVVYNDWMAEFTSHAPERLWGQALISLWDIDWAIKELERSARIGLKSATIWVAPPPELPWGSDHYERFWSACEEMAMPVTMHINSGFYPESVQQTRARGGYAYVKRIAFGHKVVAMDTLTELTFSGVFERHPRLKLLLAEFECGWIPFFLEDLDRKLGRVPEAKISMLPSEYISRQVYSGFMQDSVAGVLLERWGQDNFVYSNDYPHAGSIWPHTADTIELTLSKLPAETRRKVLGGNIARVFGLPMPEPMPREPLRDYEDVWKRDWLKKAGEFSFDKPKMGLAV